MYKFVIIVLLSFSFNFVNAQGYQIDTVIEINGVEKSALMLNSKGVLVEVFKDAKEVIQLVDDENGIIIGKGNYSYSYSYPRFSCNVNNGKGTVSFTIKLLFKDNKIKVMLYDFYHNSNDPNVNLGLVYPTFVYHDGIIKACREDIYNDIIAKNIKLLNNLATRLAKIKSDDFDF